ncbi:MAG: hypothetical protein RL120_19375 [Gammaproteobacteria bacterium]
MKTSILAGASLILASCTYADINFERMSEAELATYNEGRSISQMIICAENERSFSRVRRRECMTVEQMYGSVEQAGQLGVLNQVQGIGNIDGTNF